jgi:hypothetical protein
VVGGIATGGVVCLALLLPEGEVGSGDQALRSAESANELAGRFNEELRELRQLRSQNEEANRRNPELNKGLIRYEERTATILERMIDKMEASAGAPSTDSAHPILAQRNTPQHQSITQPFQLTSTAPHSTFSMDVDTGSYTNARKILRSGRRPSADLVRAEEFINYFSYQHPTNTEKPFSTVYDIAPSPMTKGAKILRIGVKSRESIASDKPWNLVFLIDTSGSMADHNKLPMVKEALKLLAGKMRASDRLSIVTYANGSQLHFHQRVVASLIGSTE